MNESLARTVFPRLPTREVVGKRDHFRPAADNARGTPSSASSPTKSRTGSTSPPEPTAYSASRSELQNPLTFVIRTARAPDAAFAAARAESPASTRISRSPMSRRSPTSSTDRWPTRFRTTLLAALPAIALFLAALGIYGVLAYFVSQRARELGIRLALGARPAELFRLVVGQGMRPVAIGAAVGLAGAVAITTLMQSLLFGVTAVDPAAYAAAAAVLAAIAVAACAMPALRATRVGSFDGSKRRMIAA